MARSICTSVCLALVFLFAPASAMAGEESPEVERAVLTWLDGVVIALYFLSMLAIGWFYMRRNKTEEEYLLGGRHMSPWSVGLSLFATMISTISYLAMPGEMIQHGPMYFTNIASYPLISLVVG